MAFEFPSAEICHCGLRVAGCGCSGLLAAPVHVQKLLCCCFVLAWLLLRGAPHPAPMALPARLQASILSWVGESPEPPPETAAAATAVAAQTTAAAARRQEEQQQQYCYHPLLTPADLFSLSSKGVAAGSPGVVVKDGFLGREQALRCYEGEVCLISSRHAFKQN